VFYKKKNIEYTLNRGAAPELNECLLADNEFWQRDICVRRYKGIEQRLPSHV
jgi:hypothetical protein